MSRLGSRICVLLPFHDAERTLDSAVRSIVHQSYPDWQLLLIDNASADGSGEVAAAWTRRDARIRLLREPRLGIAQALNTGLGQADAPFIARMDADDLAHPDRFDKQVAYLEAHPGIGVVGTRTRFSSTVQKSSGMRWFVDWQNRILNPHEHYVKRFVDAPLAHPTVMFRSELLSLSGGYSTDPLPEDHELWLRWMDAGVRFAKLPEQLLTWNDHIGRLSRTHPNYAVDAFFATKARWMARWMRRSLGDRPVIIAGTSALCRGRARMLQAEGISISAFTDVRRRQVAGYGFIAHDELPATGEAFIISFISQRGTGDRIAGFLASRGLVEGRDFILAA